MIGVWNLVIGDFVGVLYYSEVLSQDEAGAVDDAVHKICDMEPMAGKWQNFNWHVQEVDGHNLRQIIAAIREAQEVKGQPCIIIAHTIKGKGVSFMENNNHFHGVAPTREEAEKALQELV